MSVPPEAAISIVLILATVATLVAAPADNTLLDAARAANWTSMRSLVAKVEGGALVNTWSLS